MNSFSPFLIIAVNSTKVAPGTFKTQDIVRSKNCNQSNLKLLSPKPQRNQECKSATYSTSYSRSRSSSRSTGVLNWLKRPNHPRFYHRYAMSTLDSFSKNNLAKIPPTARASFLINEPGSVSTDRNAATKPSRSP